MTWCVCKDKQGRLLLMNRRTRELLLHWWIDVCHITPPSYVVKTFNDEIEAANFIIEMHTVDQIIDNL